MGFYWIKTNLIIKKLFSKYIWDIPNSENTIYLTFDDGPTPVITKWVLDTLNKHSIKATFFCIGKNIQSNPHLFKQVISEGHSIGNHTFNHLNGWKNTTDIYMNNIALCNDAISTLHKEKVVLFRPPYGKIKRAQSKILKSQGYKIIMWDVLSADFDQSITKEKCLENVISNIKSGSIIVFHDSVKAFQNLEYVLPKVLDYINENEFKCAVLE